MKSLKVPPSVTVMVDVLSSTSLLSSGVALLQERSQPVTTLRKFYFLTASLVRLTRLRRLEDNRRHSVRRWKVLPLLLSFYSPLFFVAAGPLLYRWCWMGWHEPTLRTHGGIKKNFKYIAFYSSTHRLLSTR